jgi:small multidrug resistance pump
MSPWVKLAFAIGLEVCATISLRQSHNFTNLWWSAAMVVGYIGSFALLAQITDQLEIGVIYAIWSAAGTAVVATLGIMLFNEQLTLTKVIGLVLIIAGVVALNLGESGGSGEESANAPPAATA